jgi:glycosyltransferase involved in cell wall biosynthesis
LPVSIKAIMQQSYAPIEMIVVDDGSTDHSVEILAELAQTYPLLKVIRNRHNQGVIFSINRALDLVRGQYIHAAGADDEVLPGFFGKSMNMLVQHPQAGLCCGHPSYVMVEADGKTGQFHEDKAPWSETPCYLSPRQLVDCLRVQQDGVRVGRNIYSPCTICRTDAVRQAGGFRPEMDWQSDYFLNHVIAFRHGICFIPETLVLFYRRPGSYNAQGRKDRAGKQEIAGRYWKLLNSDRYRDVLIPFLASGVAVFNQSGNLPAPQEQLRQSIMRQIEDYLAQCAIASEPHFVIGPNAPPEAPSETSSETTAQMRPGE